MAIHLSSVGQNATVTEIVQPVDQLVSMVYAKIHAMALVVSVVDLWTNNKLEENDLNSFKFIIISSRSNGVQWFVHKQV